MNDDEANSRPTTNDVTTDTTPGNVTLRIVILAHGSGREDDLYLVLSLDTSLGELKNRIQESLPQRPAPNLQRIIYQGRGLDDINEPLRNILRQDQRAGNSSYVLHLVIRQASVGSQSIPSGSSSTAHQTSTGTPLHQRQTQHQTQVQVPRAQVPQGTSHDNHMRIHNQIHQLQHSLQHQQALNRAHLAQVQRSFPMAHSARPDQQRSAPPVLAPNLAGGQNQGVTPYNAATGVDTSQNPAPDHLSLNAQINPSTSTTSANLPTFPHPQVPNLQATQTAPGPMPHPLTNTTQMRTVVDSNGQHTRTVVNGGPTGTTTMTFRITGLNPPNPLDRPSSAPGASPSADADPANRVINPVPGNIQIHAQPPPVPMGFPFPPGLQLPFPIPNMMPLINNPFQQLAPQNLASQPMAWLLSSPNGPQGIVFAPGHGFFNTTPAFTSISSQLQPSPSLAQAATLPTLTNPQQAQLVVRPQAEAASSAAVQTGARPQAAPTDLPAPPPPQAAPRARVRANGDQNEILQFIINRGWLFLRLYMFVFVFSESGTWRRILMIGAIIIYCSLPQQNPLTNGFQVVRRHFDNLIGPPNIPQRAPQQAQQNAQNAGQTGVRRPVETQAGSSNSTRRRAAPMPTPEETARRLLERQNRRNPNPVIDALYRFEQGIVLFLASLVPGVGERHVRAREEARRIIQEEEQRRITDAQQQAQPAVERVSGQPRQSESQAEAHGRETEDGPLPNGWKTATQLHEETYGQQASSSGVDRTGQTGNEGVRSRTTNSGE